MSVPVQDAIPKSLVRGDSVSFRITDSTHSAVDWTSKLICKSPSGETLTFVGAASGAKHLFELSGTDTAKIGLGSNSVCIQFDDGTNRETGEWADLEVLPDPATAAQKTFAQKQVESLQGVISKLQGGRFQTVNFNGQSFTENSLTEMQKQLTYWEARVIQEQKAERSKRGLMNCRSVSPAFSPPNDSVPPFLPPFS